MNRLVYVLSAIIILSSCSSNGLRKSILEPLSVEELKSNIKRDTTFENFYSSVQDLREWLKGKDILQAKYGEISYKQLKKFSARANDTTYFNKKSVEWRKDYAKLYPSYDRELDSIITYWKEYKERYSMDSLVNIEFDNLWKEYYSYLNNSYYR